jgi:hypothetical protein
MPQISASKYLTQAGWDNVPHLDEKTKSELLAGTPPHLRAARSKGEPSLGSGAIYPIDPSEFECEPFRIPDYWPRAYGLDVGWNRTAAVWGAWDTSIDCLYLYAEYYAGQQPPAVHAAAIKARGEWIKGVIDPAAQGRAQADGEQLLANYRSAGLKIDLAENSVEAGIYRVFSRLTTERLKVFTTLTKGAWGSEYRLYRRDEKGRIVKANDHLMDATRYLEMSGFAVASVRPVPQGMGQGFTGAADSTAGY